MKKLEAENKMLEADYDKLQKSEEDLSKTIKRLSDEKFKLEEDLTLSKNQTKNVNPYHHQQCRIDHHWTTTK